MIEFIYEGINSDGRECEGCIQADDQTAARIELLRKGVMVLELQSRSGDSAEFREGTRLSLSHADLLYFTRELAHLKKANLPIDKSLAVLMEGDHNISFRKFVTHLYNSVKSGKTLHQSLLMYESLVGRKYLAMIRAAEASGLLALVLKELTEQLQIEHKQRNQLITSLTYPVILLVVSVLSVVMLLMFVVPQFRGIFDSMGDSLPFMTKCVIVVSDFFSGNWQYILFGIALVGVVFGRWVKSSEGRLLFDRFLLSFPILGGVIEDIQFSVYFRTLGVLIQRKVALIESIKIAGDTVTNKFLFNELSLIVEQIKAGKKLSAVFSGGKFGAGGVSQLIRVAEETGDLDQVLLGIAERFSERSERVMSRLMSLIEPIIIITLGVIVALIIIAILGGVLSVNETI